MTRTRDHAAQGSQRASHPPRLVRPASRRPIPRRRRYLIATLLSTALLLPATPALADGAGGNNSAALGGAGEYGGAGGGGGTGGSGGAGSPRVGPGSSGSNGNGGNGSAGGVASGGTPGAAGTGGSVGSAATPVGGNGSVGGNASGGTGSIGGGGGGGGGDGFNGTTLVGVSGPIIGGNGGNGGIPTNTSVGGAGGSGGGAGAGAVLAGTGSTIVSANITGGSGGNGGASVNTGGAGFGGGGGSGLVSNGVGITNAFTILGGMGGNGGNGAQANNGRSGGTGGAGVAGTSITLTNTGTVQGGNGGASGLNAAGAPGATIAAGGAGVRGSDLQIVNAGTIAGGMNGNGTVRASAISFTGGTNSLTLQQGWNLIGGVANSGGTNTLILGGDTSDLSSNLLGTSVSTVFDVSHLNSAYQGFTAFQKTGASTWRLVGTTTAATPWVVSDGTLQVESNGNLGASGALTLQNGGTLATTASFTLARQTNLVGNGTFDVAAGTTLTSSGIISGSGTLTKLGDGTMVLGSVNTYTGATLIDDGVLRAGVANALAPSNAVTLTSGATLDLVGFDQTVNNISGDGNIALGTATLTANNTGLTSYGGAISGAGALVKTGAGTLTLRGNNSHTGGTTIAAGAIQVGNGATTGSLSGDVVNNGTLLFDRSDDVAFDGTISGTGGLAKLGAGTLTLTGANTYAGSTTLAGGTLLINGDQTGATGPTSVASGTRLGGSGIIGGNVSVANGGILAPGNSPGTLTINGDLALSDTSVLEFDFGEAGVINGPINDLIVVGGDLVLDGTLNVSVSPGGTFGPGLYRVIEYAGALTDNGLSIGTIPSPDFFLQDSVSGEINVINTAGLTLNVWDGVGARNDDFISGGSGVWQSSAGNDNWTVIDGSVNAPFSDGAFALFEAAPGVVTVDASLGAIQTSGMQFAVNGYTVTGDGIELVGPESELRVGDGTTNGAAYTATIASVLAGTGQVTKTDLGILVLSAANTYTGGTVIDGGVLRTGIANAFASSSAVTVASGATLSLNGFGQLANNLSGAGNVTLGSATLTANNTANTSFSGIISGAGALVKTGTGTLTLSGINTFTGPTTINAGVLHLDYTGALTPAISGNIVNNSVLRISHSAPPPTVIYGGVISGSGSLEKLGPGRLHLTGENTYLGGTTISAGVLQVGDGGSTGSIAGNVTVNSGATFYFNRTVPWTYGGVISGAGGVIVNGGRLILTGANTYTGNTVVQGTVPGTLQVGNGGTTGSIVGNVTGAGTLEFNRSDTLTWAGARTAGTVGALVQSGTGALILTGNHFHLGGTTINAGTMQLGNGGTTGSINNGNILNNGALVFNRSNAMTFAGVVSGSGTVLQAGGGTTTLTGANSYAGITSVSSGTLLINGNQTAATGLTAVASGATLGGSGTIGGDVSISDGGILAPGNSPGTLTINGTLSLSSGSILNYELGQANTAGGTFNDLVNVGGDLVLDGTLNVSLSSGGTFGTGLYRVINYAGALTNNGLVVGTIPTAGHYVQTTVANQVNLVNTNGLTLNYWDGAAGPRNNSVINGGDGSWQASTGNDNWTEVTGAVNAPFTDGAFAIFMGAPGTVTVDDSLGAVTASGIQFAVDGYTVTGSELELVGPASELRVGNGTAGGAAYTATIQSGLAGNTRVTKSDFGTLILSGVNSYTGGTAIIAGVLEVSSDANLGAATGDLSLDGGTLRTTAALATTRDVALNAAGGTFEVTGGPLTLGGAVFGPGALTKSGAGMLTLASDTSYAGGTTIAEGVLRLGAGGTAGLVTGDVANEGLLVFDRSDGITLGGTISGSGAVQQAGSGVTILQGANGYAGGTLVTAGTLVANLGGSLGTGAVQNQATLELAFAADGTLANVLSGSGLLLKSEAGNAAITGGGTVGNVDVEAGTLTFSLPGVFTVGDAYVTRAGATTTLSGLAQLAVGGAFTQAAGATLNVSLGVEPLVTAATASLDGTLNVTGFSGTPPLLASALPGSRFTVISTTGGVSGDFATIGFGAASSPVDYLHLLGAVSASGLDYEVGFGLTWLAGPINGNGVFTLAQGATFTVDVPLNDQAPSATGWSGTVLTKQGPGTLILSATNSYTGGTAINGGVLAVSSDANLGAATGELSFDGGTLRTTAAIAMAREIALNAAGGTFEVAAGPLTLNGAVSGPGGLTKSGSGTLILASDTNYAGITTIAGGTLRLGAGGTSGLVTGDVANGGLLVFDRSDGAIIGGVISGAGAVEQAGSGVTILLGANSYIGGTTISAGTLQLGSGGATGSIVGNVTNNGVLAFNRSDAVTFGGLISGSGSVIQAGSGTTVLTGSNSYLGPTTINAGTLKINGDQSAAIGLTTAMSGATLGGSGTVGGDVVIADGGTLSPGNSPGTLTINGNLSLSAGSLLSYDFGEAGVVNGPINDLTNVGGDLMLDGTLNIVVSPGGAFDPGIYRVINYAGTLTDNGLTLGTIPSPDYFVQVSVDHEVNLINTGGLVLDYWDGAAGPKNDGAVNGGDGVWQDRNGNDNWTGPDGLINAPFADASFAIFEAAPGVVTVDASLGAINVAGMQFASNGYRITGDAITLVGTAATPAETLIRVGDGTTGGAVYVATIEAILSGPSGLNKDDLGTLILAGANTYAGPTLVEGGTLLINGDQSGATGATTVEIGATLGGIGTIGGDVAVADGGILAPGGSPGTLTINGNLSLSSGSILDYELGAANVVGGALNDLVVVGGDLVLDGTVNVSVPAGGTFATGVYRLIDYAGGLTDNGLALGVVPSADVYVQTSIANQVNLVNTSGLLLNYWDGAAGPKNNGVVNGGDGVWQTSVGNDNWTEATGAINAPFSDGAFAIFMGSPGTVAIDNSLGPVTASGMQFLVDGYTLTGDALTLVAPVSEIRVGDGTAAGTAIATTIAATLGGTTQLNKTDLGTLILAGTNSYTGGTAIAAGTLQIGDGGSSGSIVGDVANAGTLAFNRSDTLSFGGVISGAGAVRQAGSGTTVLSGANIHTGITTVAAGTLQAGATNSFSAASEHEVASGATLALGGFGQRIAALANAGTVLFAAGGAPAGTVLDVLGDYVGFGGTLVINTELEGDGSPTDLLRIGGASSGTGLVQVVNAGGGGALTDSGIKVIEVTGASDAAFTLLGDFVTTTGEQAVVAGAYAYTLNQGGKADPNDGDWYLRSELTKNEIGEPTPLFNPGTPLYENYAPALLALNGLPTLRQRVGYRAGTREGAETAADEGTRIWGRVDAGFGRSEPAVSTAFSDRSDETYTFNGGAELLLSEGADGSVLLGGITARYVTGTSDVRSIEGMGRIETDGFGIGATLTWYGGSGFYADAQAHYDWYRTDLTSHTGGKLMAEDNDGHGYAFSLEGGWQTDIGGGFKLTPQAQLTYSRVSFEDFDDSFEAHISGGKGESLRARFGLAFDRETRSTDASGRSRSSHFYVVPNLYYEFLDGAEVTVSGPDGDNPTLFVNRNQRTWAGLGIGGANSWNNDTMTLFAEANLDTPLENAMDSYQLSARFGLKMSW